MRASLYREHAPPRELESLVACLWQRETLADCALRIVPDGCVDLLWMEDELVFAGADTAAREAVLRGGRTAFGIRLRPGAAGAVLGVPASELRDRQVGAPDVWGATRDLEPELRATPFAALERAVAARCAEPDELVRAAAALLGRAEARVATVAAELGVSERQLNRRTLAAVGYGPKMLARVARLRRLTALPGASLARRALDAGYASQSHMTDEVRRLTGLTPVRFLEEAAPVAA
jgi:AraC-like DNA-binding protein